MDSNAQHSQAFDGFDPKEEPKRRKMHPAFSFLLRFGFSAALLGVLFFRIDWQTTRETLSAASLPMIGVAFVIFIFLNFLLIFRWFVFMRALSLKVPALQAIRYYFIGLFGNLFLPSAIGGDLIKIFGLCKGREEKSKVVASVLLDRLSGFVSIILVSAIAFVFAFSLIRDMTLLLVIGALSAGMIVLGIILFNRRVYHFFCQVFNAFPKIKKAVMTLHDDLALLGSNIRPALFAIGIACFCQVCLAVCFYFTALGLNQNVNLVYFLIFVPLICVASAFPSIGGLGVREAGAAYLFAKIGIDPGIAVSISLMTFLFMVIVGLTGGAVYVFTLSSGRIQHYPQNAGVRGTQS